MTLKSAWVAGGSSLTAPPRGHRLPLPEATDDSQATPSHYLPYFSFLAVTGAVMGMSGLPQEGQHSTALAVLNNHKV